MRTVNQFFCSLFTIRQVTFSHTDGGTQGHALINTRICISMKTANQWLDCEGQKTSYICKGMSLLYWTNAAFCVSSLPDRGTAHLLQMWTHQVLTLVRLRPQFRAAASLWPAEVLLSEPLEQFSFLLELPILIHGQDFGFECCRFWLTLLVQARCGLQ